MLEKKSIRATAAQHWLAIAMILIGTVAITVLAAIAIVADSKNAMTIFNMALPVIASWIGTILAFYFGRENFESANQQVRELVQRLTPEERAKTPVAAVMRRLVDMAYTQIPKGKSDQDLTVKDLRDKFTSTVTRIPVTDADTKPKYMIHQGRLDNYIASGGKDADTLATFLTQQQTAGFAFGPGKGFVLVSEKATLAEAKRKMEEATGCKDVFITKGGTADEPLIGWIADTRMGKYLEA
jgi:CBS domain-containing protein